MADFAVDAVVAGAGVIGLAIGRALAQAGMETLVLESSAVIGQETTSRNSEVIHAGIYYPEGSLKAQLCVRGKHMLYAYLAEHQIEYQQCGKLIVAVDETEAAGLLAIKDKAARCGVPDLQALDAQDVAAMESEVCAVAGLFSPSTGVLDVHQYLLQLQADLEAAGGMVVVNTPVAGGVIGRERAHEIRLGGDTPGTVGCGVFVNAAGLWADRVISGFSGALPEVVPAHQFAIGHYYSYSGAAPFSRLVYPMPNSAGLGVHATIDLAGQVRFGPDVRWINEIDYAFDDAQRDAFIAAVQRYFPALQPQRMQPGYTGIRPKVVGPGESPADFVFLQSAQRHNGFLTLHGIESPGLTSSLAIAERVAAAVS